MNLIYKHFAFIITVIILQGLGSAAPQSYSFDQDLGLSIGFKAVGGSGLSGAGGDLSYSIAKYIPGLSVRGGFGYMTGGTNADVDPLKLTTVNLDAVYQIDTQQDSPLSIYVGGGLLMPWKVNKNRGSGAWGAHAYIGSKYTIEDNFSIFGELAYRGIKYQAEEAAIKGVEATLGYIYSF